MKTEQILVFFFCFFFLGGGVVFNCDIKVLNGKYVNDHVID